MKKQLSRVRRKKGAVLFAVIAIMALLIAMASTAYFTARSAYNSVISNYSYSQLYLSAISVSDMVVEAVMNDSIANASSDDGVDSKLNYYDSLRDAVLGINTVGEVKYAYSENISDPKATEAAILSELRESGENGIVPGVLDGVVVSISLDSIDNERVSPQVAEDGKSTWYVKDYNYKFTTNAFYRNNAIIVEDIIKAEKLVLFTPGSGSNGDSGKNPIINDDIIVKIPDNGTPPPTFFTATGQKLGENGIERTTRTVKIKTHEISDDAFFQNSSTYFVNGNNNEFVGGITSTGSVYLEKFTTSITGDNNDWWIGDDLVMTNNNANDLNLTDQNSIYINGDLVIAANGKITAEDIYVMGDAYIMGQANIQGNLHVAGNIYYEMGDTVVDDDGNESASASATAAADGVTLGSTRWDHYVNGWSVSGDLDVNGSVYVPDGCTNDARITVGGQQITIPSGSSASTGSNGIGTFDPSSTNIDYSVRVPDENDIDGDGNTDEYLEYPQSSTVSGGINDMVGTNQDFDNITAPSTAYDTEVNVDFNNLEAVLNADGQIAYYEYYDSETGLYIATEDANLNGNVSVTIPYIEGGYVLDIDAESIEGVLGGNVNITYNIETSDDPDADPLPIILADNITIDADDDGEEDDPGFAWQGYNYSSNDNSSGTIVQTIGDGNVVMELANLNGDGDPVPYTANGNTTTVTYVAGQKEVVGTDDQCALIGAGGNLTEGVVNSMLQPGTSIPLSQYENRIMLVSNMNDGVAVDAARQNNAFCGYIYAPNGELDNYAASGETAPIFGGMVVSTYNAELSKLYYAEPKPSLMSSIFDSWSPNSETIVIDVPDDWENWQVPPIPPGPGTWGDPQNTDEWGYKGSNFVG